MPHRQPKRGRLWLNDSLCVRLRPEYPNHVWSYDFVEDRAHNGRKIRMLNVIDVRGSDPARTQPGWQDTEHHTAGSGRSVDLSALSDQHPQDNLAV